MPQVVLKWEQVGSEESLPSGDVRVDGLRDIHRAEVPGGWLVQVGAKNDMALTFLPDEKHRWGKPEEPLNYR